MKFGSDEYLENVSILYLLNYLFILFVYFLKKYIKKQSDCNL